MTVLRWLVRIVAALVALIALVYFGARFHDGPLGPIPGGPLAAGEVVSEPVADWSFAKDTGEIELQLDSQRQSRTVWFFVLDGKAYVPCSLGYPPGKTWHKQAVVNGSATLRIDGKRYPVTLTKLDDTIAQQMGDAVRAELTRKYGQLPPSEGGAWLFQVTARSAGRRLESGALIELHVVAVGVAQEGAQHLSARRFAVGERVADARVEQHVEPRGARARDDRMNVLHPEREVVDAGLEQPRGLARRSRVERLIEHDERLVRPLAPPEIGRAPLARLRPFEAGQLLDRVELHAQAERVAVEAQRAVHVAHADGHVGDRPDRHCTSCVGWASDRSVAAAHRLLCGKRGELPNARPRAPRRRLDRYKANVYFERPLRQPHDPARRRIAEERRRDPAGELTFDTAAPERWS